MLQKILKILKGKTQLEKLQLKQEKLLKQAYEHSKNDRKKSDSYVQKANDVAKLIDVIMKNNTTP